MNIVQENSSKLQSLIKVKLSPADYKDKYETALKSYAKKATIKGFRPGHVPVAMIKKMYGKALLAEEINKMLNEALHKHITDNKLEILGNPIPTEEQEKVNFHEDAEMEFVYEIGLAPVIDLDLSKLNVTYNALLVDDKLIAKQTEDLKRRYGKLVNADLSTETDMLFGTFEELDENNNVVEGGIKHTSTISVEYLHDDQLKKKLSGLKPGDVVNVDPRKVSHSATDMAAMLGVKKEEIGSIGRNFNFTINEIKRIDPAELNQEFFDKLFGAGKVNSESEFQEKVKADLVNMFAFDSDRLFFKEATEQMIDKISVELPDEFLKRWIVTSNENPVTFEQVEAEYDNYSKGLKWQLIENKIIKDNDLKVGNEEALEYTKGYIVSQYTRYGIQAPDDEALMQSAVRILQKQDEAKRIYDELYNRKVMTFLKETVKLNQKDVAYDDFVKMLGGAEEHHHDHDHEHDHEH